MQTDFGTARRTRARRQALLALGAQRAECGRVLPPLGCEHRELLRLAQTAGGRGGKGAARRGADVRACLSRPRPPVGAGGETGIAAGFGAGWEIELDLGAGAVLRLRRR
jgi:hypothetical protein